jgi:hypothetical protein
LEEITKFAITSRYDINFLKGVKEEDAKEALEIAQKGKGIYP